MSTKAAGDSCYDKAAPNEPLFVLRAQDKLAPWVLATWINLATALGTPRAKLDEATDLLAQMNAWQTKYGCKVPD